MRAAFRVAWTIATLVVVQGIVCAVSAAPVVVAWRWMFSTVGPHPYARVVLCSAALAPSYVVFAMCLMIVSPLAVRALGWRTPPDTEMRIAEMDWALLAWVRYGASMHLARIVAGTLVRGTPIWTFHLRLAGARLGRRVFVNSLTVSDYNLIECGDDVVIGSAVHMSGHTVEAGIVKTAGIRLADNVTLGIGAVIEIGVTIEANTQIGALSFVPKYTKLKGDAVYAGAPVTRLESAPPL